MRIPGFDILEKLGEGGMAVVWKAYQVSLDRIVAIKILKPQFAQNPDEVRDFILEARSAARLKHQNVVQVYDVAEQNGTYYFVMEFVSGVTATRLIEQHGKIPNKQAIKIAKAVAEALDCAWQKNRLIHRDIKPENIMIDDDGNIKLADLGLARMADPRSSVRVDQGLIEGTPNYMSPEQARFSSTLDCRTDMYSLGASLYHMLTGILPFSTPTPSETLRMHISGHLQNPRDLNPEVSLPMSLFITKLMMKDPRDRYAEWADVLKDLKRISMGRMVVLKKGAGDVPPESTIALPRSKSAAGTSSGRQVADLPRVAHIAAWICILAIWMVFLYREAVHAPFFPPAEGGDSNVSVSQLPSVEIRESGSTETTLPSTPKMDESLTEAKPRSDEPKTETDEETASDTVASDSAPAAEEQPIDTPSSSQEGEADTLTDLKLAIAQNLLSRNFTKATALLDAERLKTHPEGTKKQVDELKKLIVDVSAMPNVIESAFRKKLGQEVEIAMKGKTRILLLRAISKGTVNAALLSKRGETGGTSTTFAISELDPAERNKWLGPANTPSKCCMKFLLAAEAADWNAAKDYASGCGILSDTLIKEMESRASSDQPTQ